MLMRVLDVGDESPEFDGTLRQKCLRWDDVDPHFARY